MSGCWVEGSRGLAVRELLVSKGFGSLDWQLGGQGSRCHGPRVRAGGGGSQGVGYGVKKALSLRQVIAYDLEQRCAADINKHAAHMSSLSAKHVTSCPGELES